MPGGSAAKSYRERGTWTSELSGHGVGTQPARLHCSASLWRKRLGTLVPLKCLALHTLFCGLIHSEIDGLKKGVGDHFMISVVRARRQLTMTMRRVVINDICGARAAVCCCS